MKNKLLHVEHIHKKTEAGDTLLKVDNITVNQGEFILITGRNGSGKTMFFRYILGLESDRDSCVSLRGIKIDSPVSQVKDRISFVPQHPENFLLGLTVEEDLGFSLSGRSTDETSLVKNRYLDKFNLSHIRNRASVVLSGGEIRRLALASASITSPDILLLDEPFAELDYNGICDLIAFLRELHDHGTTILLITHDVTKILAQVNRVFLFDNNTIAYDISPQEFLNLTGNLGVRIPSMNLKDCTWEA